MKRLLRISFDLSLLSFIPILSWFLLSIIIDKSLINTFTLTYPIQFVSYMILSIFSTGANISKEKDHNKHAVMSGLFLGTICSILIFSMILFHVEDYIHFMNMDIETYKIFTIYSIIQIFISLEFSMILKKLYFEEKNKLANHYSFLFNGLNFVVLIGTALLTKNQVTIVSTTLIVLALFTIYIYIKNSNKFCFQLNLIKCIKYDSIELCENIFFIIIYLFGLSNALEYGENFTIALTFVSLITDTQWDTIAAIKTAATIDISKSCFNYKQHRNNAYKLVAILLSTSFIMFVSLHHFYQLDLKITMIYCSFEIINFLIYPIYKIKACYLQLEWSPFVATSNKLTSSILRTVLSFLKTPFCTGIGQVSASIYQLITFSALFKAHYKVDKLGNVIPKKD